MLRSSLVAVLGFLSASIPLVTVGQDRLNRLVWPAVDRTALDLDNPAQPPRIYNQVPATEFGFVAHQVRIPPHQSLPIKASWSEEGKLIAELGGESAVIAVRVKRVYEDDQQRIQNPLSTMSDDEIHALWGIVIEAWTSDLELQLQSTDRDKVLITIVQDGIDGTTNPLPPLPHDLRFLRVQFNSSSEPITDMGVLRLLTNLEHFDLHGFRGQSFDAEVLSACQQLEYLSVTGHEIVNQQALGTLLSLRHLNLPFHRDKLNNLEFAAGLKKLETLDVSMCAISNLEPLGELGSLKWVNADLTYVDRLPEKLPLEVLRVQSSELSDQEVARFAKQNPECVILHRWEDSLKNFTAAATRVAVFTHRYQVNRSANDSAPLFETSDPDVITELIDGIVVDEPSSGFYCGCAGTPFLTFYQDETVLAIVGFHHGRSLRWESGWPADGMLTPTSGKFLVDWLDTHGVSGPAEEIRMMERQQMADARKAERAVAGLPKEVAKAFQGRSGQFSAILRRELPNREDQITALFRILGCSNNSWSQLDWIEQFADAELRSYSVDDLSHAAEIAIKGDDRRARRGAARLWQSYDSPLQSWMPEDADLLHQRVVALMAESRYYPLRQDAMRRLSSWRASFPNEMQIKLVQRALADPHPSVRRSAMLAAGSLRLDSTAQHLMSILSGSEPTVVPLPEVPEDETVDVDEGFDNVAGNRPENEVAALALGFLRHKPAVAQIKAQETPSPMYEVALALLGERDQLKPDHFNLPEDNSVLQLAALEVVLETRGAYGLKWATEYQQSEYWWEEDYVATRLSQMLVKEKAPGAYLLVDCDDLDQVVQWYQQHGEAYVREIKRRQPQDKE